MLSMYLLNCEEFLYFCQALSFSSSQGILTADCEAAFHHTLTGLFQAEKQPAKESQEH